MQYRGRMDSRPHTLQDALCHYSIHTSPLQPSSKQEDILRLTLWTVMTHLLPGNMRSYSREVFLLWSSLGESRASVRPMRTGILFHPPKNGNAPSGAEYTALGAGVGKEGQTGSAQKHFLCNEHGRAPMLCHTWKNRDLTCPYHYF